ncbi:MAG TPA: tRNA (adenosine(37)-N6)-threonylcarbamoyltransferase complex dimerization subunit type 1 TsaB [Smithellaceae bacterium]|nr:tRNA (adenosine(37)-N6)-threonylcarbamoyltransferase complex dimerization subunit type 1 TsaB [Smithellaceae bacterium]
MLILAFDTSSPTASVALLRHNTILYEVLINTGLNHSEILLPAIDEAMRKVDLAMKDIDLLACTSGPGSFTGLRIGCSTLKGLAFATEKPAVAVSSLEAVASNICPTSRMICAMLDAGRGQVYTACYRLNKTGALEKIGGEKAACPQEIIKETEGDVIFAGDGAMRYAEIIKGSGKKNFLIVSGAQNYIRASAVGIIAREKYRRNELINPATFTPLYLRPADARPKKPLFENN